MNTLFYFPIFTPIMPPSIPVNILAIINITEFVFTVKSPINALDIRYKSNIYMNPIIPPYKSPYFFSFILLN